MKDKVQKVQKIREAIDKIQDSTMDKNGNFNSDYDQGRYDALCDADTLLQNLLVEFILEQKLSNVERTGKDWKEKPVKRNPADIEAAMQEVEEKSRVFTEAHKGEEADTILAQMRGKEPVSEDLEEASKKWLRPQLDKSYAKYGEAKMMELTHFDGYAMLDAIEFGAKWQKTKDESTTEDLGEYINDLSKQFPEVSFAKLSRITVRVAKWQAEQFEKDYTDLCNGIATAKGIAVTMAYEKGVADTKVQMMKNIWKPADGDDLPEIDREVIVLIKYNTQRNIHDKEYSTYKVGFGHRPNPDGWDGKNIDTNEVTHYTPKLYDKGGWNAPDIVYWLDARLPYEEK